MGVRIAIISICLAMVACKKADKETYIARYGNQYLTREEVSKMLPADVTKTDSINRVESYIHEWARNQAMLEKAEDNLTENEKTGFENNIEKYRSDLYINAYSKLLISQLLDTIVTQNQMKDYYDNNKAAFVLKENLVKYRFATFLKGEPELGSAAGWIKSKRASDISQLEDLCIQKAIDYNLNDTIWTKVTELKRRIGSNKMNKSSYSNNYYTELKDSSSVTLLYITNTKFASDPMPMDYAKDIIKENIINKRKLEILKDVSQKLIDEAINDSDFEIYTNEKK